MNEWATNFSSSPSCAYISVPRTGNPLDKPLTDLIGELSARSHPFAAKWAQHEVRLHRTATKHLHNTVVGDIELTGDALDLPGEGLTIIAYTAATGSAAEEQLALLASWRRTLTSAARH